MIAITAPLCSQMPVADLAAAAPVYTAGAVEVAVALGPDMPGMPIAVSFAVGVAFPAPTGPIIGGRAGLPVIPLPPLPPVALFVLDTDRLSTSTSVLSGLRTLEVCVRMEVGWMDVWVGWGFVLTG